MNFKRLAVAAALGSATVSGAALAEVSVNVGVASQYLFRGLEQGPGAAVSGGIDYASESGFYVGTWASNIGFASASGSSAEVDFYAGFGGEAGGVGYDLGAIYYWYPEEDEPGSPPTSNNTIEFYGSVSMGPVSLGTYIAPDTYFGIDESAYGFSLGFSAPVSEMLSFDASVQYNGGDANEMIVAGITGVMEEYLDYSIGLSAESESGLSFGLALVATDIDDDDIKPVISGGYSF